MNAFTQNQNAGQAQQPMGMGQQQPMAGQGQKEDYGDKGKFRPHLTSGILHRT